MDLPSVIWHLAGFLAPALVVAALLPLATRLSRSKQVPALSPWAQFAINFAVGLGVLLLSLWLLQRDGKMLAYLFMTLGCATSQWVQQRGWR